MTVMMRVKRCSVIIRYAGIQSRERENRRGKFCRHLLGRIIVAGGVFEAGGISQPPSAVIANLVVTCEIAINAKYVITGSIIIYLAIAYHRPPSHQEIPNARNQQRSYRKERCPWRGKLEKVVKVVK
jgi:hypothetical protein